MSPTADSLAAALSRSYRIERELGAGGIMNSIGARE